MHDVLGQVIAKEAKRLLDSPDPLTPAQLEALAVLCRCAKVLGQDQPAAGEGPPPDEPTVAGDLALVEPS